MRIRDVSMRTYRKPKHDLEILLSFAEAAELLDDIGEHCRDWPFEDCALARFANLLAREQETRPGRKPNPGWFGQEGPELPDAL